MMSADLGVPPRMVAVMALVLLVVAGMIWGTAPAVASVVVSIALGCLLWAFMVRTRRGGRVSAYTVDRSAHSGGDDPRHIRMPLPKPRALRPGEFDDLVYRIQRLEEEDDEEYEEYEEEDDEEYDDINSLIDTERDHIVIGIGSDLVADEIPLEVIEGITDTVVTKLHSAGVSNLSDMTCLGAADIASVCDVGVETAAEWLADAMCIVVGAGVDGVHELADWRADELLEVIRDAVHDGTVHLPDGYQVTEAKVVHWISAAREYLS